MQQKGSGLKSLLLAIERLHGESGLRAVLDAVPADVRADLVAPILPVRWYPIRHFACVHLAVRDRLGKGRWEVSRALGREAGRIDFGQMYRVLLRTTSYETLWGRIRTAWRNYNSAGNAEWDTQQEGAASGRVWNVSGFNTGQWYSVAGRAEQLLLLAGAKSASIEVIDPTPTSCRFDAMYVK